MDMPETSLCWDGQSSVDKASDFAPRLLFSEDFCQNNCVHRKFSTASVSAASMAMLCRGEFEGSQLCRLSQVRFLVGVSHCGRVDHRNCTTEFLQLAELFNRAFFFFCTLCFIFRKPHDHEDFFLFVCAAAFSVFLSPSRPSSQAHTSAWHWCCSKHLIDAPDLYSVILVEEDDHQSWWQVATSTSARDAT